MVMIALEWTISFCFSFVSLFVLFGIIILVQLDYVYIDIIEL